MNIGILGAGRIGTTVAQLLGKAGHKVSLSHSGAPESLTQLTSQLGPNVKPTTSEQAVDNAEVILLAIPWAKRQNIPATGFFDGKIVIDALNAYSENFEAIDFGNTTSSEEVLKLIPRARLVKAFNTMYFETLRDHGNVSAPLDDRLVLFMAGDDTEAKEVVARLIEDCGFATIDTGFLHEGGRKQQPGSPIYNVPIRGNEAQKRLMDL